MKKLLVITIVLAISALLFTACSQPAVQPDPVPPVAQNDVPAAKIASNAVDAQGKLIGRIDNNSVEIEMTPVDTLAFRVTDVLGQLEGIKDGDMVKFSYEQNADGQMVITKIEKQ